jgi:hypothetical protein
MGQIIGVIFVTVGVVWATIDTASATTEVNISKKKIKMIQSIYSTSNRQIQVARPISLLALHYSSLP